MIILTDQEAKDIRLAIQLGQTSFCRDEGLMDMPTDEANEYLEQDSPTKHLLHSIAKGSWIICNKIKEEENKDQSSINNRWEILDIR
jgi:hypothetical protein